MARARALAVVGMLAAATLLAVWILPSTVALSGGPDAYGYTFDDAVPYSWIPAAGIVVADNADNCQNPGGTPDFGFGTFTYYGVAYTDVLVCPNGFVKFTGATTTGLTASSTIPYTPIPNADIVALSASGLNPTLPGSGDIYFDEQPAATVVTWDLVNITGTVQVQFQIILRDTGVIDIQYNDVPAAYGTSPSGIESSLGDTGLQYSGFSLPPRIANGVTVRYTPPSPALVDTLTVTGEDHAPAALEQTATDVRMARYLLTAGSGAVAVKAVRLEKLGTIADAAVYLRLVNDTNDNAVYDPGIDTSVTGWTTPTGGVVAQSFNAPYVVKPGLPQRWIALAYCLCTAIPGSTLGVRVASALPSFDVAGIDAVAYSPGSPIDSSLSTVTAFPTSTLSATFTDLAPASISQGQEYVPLLGMNLSVDIGLVRVTQMNVTLTGAPPSDSDIRAVLLVADNNGNAAYDYFEDQVLGTTAFTGGVAMFFPWATIPAGNPLELLVAVSISNDAGVGNTVGARLAASTEMVTDTCNAVISPAGFPGGSADAVITAGTPNTVTLLTWNDRAPATVYQGSENVVMAEFGLSVDTGVARMDWSGGLNVTLTGAPPDPMDIGGGFGQANLWEDMDGDGAWALGVDRFIGGGWFAAVGPDWIARIAPFGAGTLEIHAGAPRAFLLTYSIATGATPGNTVGARVDNTSSLQFLTNTLLAPANLPAQTTNSVIAASVADTLTHALTDLAPATVAPFDRGVPFGQLRLDVVPGPGGNSVQVTGLSVQRLGNATDADVAAVTVVHDVNGNGAFDGASDISLASATFAGGMAWLGFDFLGEGIAVGGGAPEDLLLLLDLDPNAVPTRTVGLRLASATDILIDMAGGDSVDPAGFPHDTSLATLAGPVATPSLVSPWTVVLPTVDGTVTGGEWADALPVDLLAVAGNELEARLLLKNDATHLYLAYDVSGDHSRSANDYAAVAFDTDNDGVATDGREDVFGAGSFFASQNHWTWDAVLGTWMLEDGPFDAGLPNHASLDLVRGFGPSPVEANPHETAEFRIPLALLGAIPGDTLGFAAGSPPWPYAGAYDNLGMGIGPSAAWPLAFGTAFLAPQLPRFGDLTLSSGAPSDLLVSGTDRAPPVVVRGQTDVLMESLTLTATVPLVTLDALTVTRSGTGTDADTAAVRLYDDVNDNGIYDAGTDTLLAGPVTFGGGAATMPGLGKAIAAGTPESLLLLYDVAAGATPGATVGALMPDPSAFTMAGGATVGGTFPVQSTDSRVNTPPSSSTLAVNGYLDGTPGILHIVTPPADPILSWTTTDADGDPQGAYEVEVWTGPSGTGTNTWDTGVVPGPTTSVPYAGTPVADGATYYLRTLVSDGFEWGGWTEVAFRINTPPPASGPPIDPLDDSVVPSTAGQIVRWGTVTDAETDSILYSWEVEENGACGFAVLLSTGGTGVNASGAFATQPGAGYCWRVEANDSWEGSGWSPAWNFTTANALPTATGLGVDGFPEGTPGILHVLTASPLLNWTYGDFEGLPQAAYEVRVGSAPGLGDLWSPGPIAGAASSVAYGGAPLVDGTDYWYGITVSDGAAWSPWAEAPFHTNSPPAVPGVPISPPDTAVVPASGSQVVTWGDSLDGEGDTLSYAWEVEENGPCSFALLLASGTTAVNVSAPFPTAVTSAYCWRVQADDGWETSGWGPAWGFTTNALTNSAPTLTLPAVTPIVGDAATVFSYTVRYSDPEGDAPAGAFPAVSIEKGGVPLTGAPFTMVFDAWVGAPADWVAGADFRYDTALVAGGVDYAYAYAAADALGAFASTSLIDAPDVTNSPPLLSWLGVGNYTSGGVDPGVGTTTTPFTYQVAYSDANGDAPLTTEVEIERPLGTPWGTFPLNAGAWVGLPGDFIAGRVYGTSLSLAPSGMDYHYRFTASDGLSAAIGAPTAFVDAPDVDDPPLAVASGTPSAGNLSTVFAFDASGSLDDMGILAWRWDFGDGTNATTATATHLYTIRGTFFVTLAVWDARNQTGADTLTVEVLNRAPAADAGPDQTVTVAATVTLNASASTDPDGDPVVSTWTQTGGPAVALVGAGTPTPSFVPPVAGDYVFQVAVSDGLGGSAVDSVTVRVTPNLPPTAVISVIPMNGTLATAFAFDGTASTDPDGVIASYDWDFGDGSTAPTAAPTHTFTARGAFVVTLTVTDDDGATGQATLSVAIGNRGPVLVSWDPTGAAVTLPSGAERLFAVIATDPDGDPLTYAWTVGGLPVGTDAALFTFHARSPGTYPVRVVISDGRDEVTREWTVEVASEFPWLLAVLLAIALVVALLFLLLWARRRKKKPEEQAPTARSASPESKEETPDIPPPPDLPAERPAPEPVGGRAGDTR